MYSEDSRRPPVSRWHFLSGPYIEGKTGKLFIFPLLYDGVLYLLESVLSMTEPLYIFYSSGSKHVISLITVNIYLIFLSIAHCRSGLARFYLN